MQRKCNRFLELLNSNKKVFLVYIIKYIPLFDLKKELNEVINLSNSVNVNILVIYNGYRIYTNWSLLLYN